MIAFDFDGVFTDNRVWVDETGRESVCCSRSDALGLRKLDRLGVSYVILSTEKNPVVAARAVKIGAPFTQGLDDKVQALTAAAAERGVTLAETAFVGNDVNDAPALRAAGLAIVVADAHRDVQSLADYRTRTGGGVGAVREICDIFEAVRSRKR